RLLQVVPQVRLKPIQKLRISRPRFNRQGLLQALARHVETVARHGKLRLQCERRHQLWIQPQRLVNRGQRLRKLVRDKQSVGLLVCSRSWRRRTKQAYREEQNRNNAPCHGLTSSKTSMTRSTATLFICWTLPPGHRISIFGTTRFEPSPKRT